MSAVRPEDDVAERLAELRDPRFIGQEAMRWAAADLIERLQREREQMAARIAELEAGERVEGTAWPELGGWMFGLKRTPQLPDEIPATLILRRPSSDSSSTEHNPAADPRVSTEFTTLNEPSSATNE